MTPPHDSHGYTRARRAPPKATALKWPSITAGECQGFFVAKGDNLHAPWGSTGAFGKRQNSPTRVPTSSSKDAVSAHGGA